MTFAVGDEVFLVHMMGEEFERPLRVRVTDNALKRSLLYSYEVEISHCQVECAETATKRDIENLKVFVRDEWLVPVEYQIDEMDTPFD